MSDFGLHDVQFGLYVLVVEDHVEDCETVSLTDLLEQLYWDIGEASGATGGDEVYSSLCEPYHLEPLDPIPEEHDNSSNGHGPYDYWQDMQP